MNNIKINYIIASHQAISQKREKYDKETNKILQKHLKILSNCLKNTKHISQVTIIKPEIKSSIPTYADYYEIDNSITKIKNLNINVVIVNSPNFKSSYDQYLYAYSKFSNFDYFILMEDDWVPHPDTNFFDEILLKYYIQNLPNKGFLCSWAPQKFVFNRLHACIAVGILNKYTFEVISKNKEINIGQRGFSNLFLNRDLPIKDYSEQGKNYMIPFWETNSGVIFEYAKYISNNYLLVPIQLLERDKYPNYLINHKYISEKVIY